MITSDDMNRIKELSVKCAIDIYSIASSDGRHADSLHMSAYMGALCSTILKATFETTQNHLGEERATLWLETLFKSLSNSIDVKIYLEKSKSEVPHA